MSSATDFQEVSLERRGVFSAFALPTGCNVVLKAGAQAAILDHEVSLGTEATRGGGREQWHEPRASRTSLETRGDIGMVTMTRERDDVWGLGTTYTWGPEKYRWDHTRKNDLA